MVKRGKFIRAGWAAAILFSLAVTVQAQQSSTLDLDAPEIVYLNIDSPVHAGKSVLVRAKVRDVSAIEEVALHVLRDDLSQFQRINLRRLEDGVYEAVVPAESVRRPLLRYYFSVIDAFGNQRVRGSKDALLTIAVVEPATETGPLPVARGALETAPSSAAAEATTFGPRVWKWVVGALAVGAIAALAQEKDPEPGQSGDSSPVTGRVTLTDIPAPQ